MVKRKKLLAIIGARPQFIKHFPLEKVLISEFELITIHTGQHYDHMLSEHFINELDIPKINYNLKIEQ